MLYLSSTELRKREANATKCQPSGIRCSSARPRPFLDASHLLPVSKLGLKCLFSVASRFFFNLVERFFMSISPKEFHIFLVMLINVGKVVIYWI